MEETPPPVPIDVMVVDDEPGVCEVGELMLINNGLSVKSFTNSGEAVAAFTEHPHRFRSILLDVMMPTPNGQEVFTAVRAIRPEMKIVVMSGLKAQNVLSDWDGDIDGFLQKPFNWTTAAAKLRELLRQ